MAAAEKAVTKAEVSAEKRFDSVNEFRAAMKDQTSSFADKAQVDFRLGAIERKLEGFVGVNQGYTNIWGYLIGAVTIAAGVAVVLTRFIK